MATSLFRQEALEHHREKLWGDVALPSSLPLAVLTGFVVSSIVAIAVFLWAGTYARKETVPGFLVPKLGVAKVTPPRAGTIIAVHVAEGDIVEEGQKLLSVRVEQATDGGENVDSSIIESMHRQRAALLEQIDLEQSKVGQEEARLTDKIVALEAERSALGAELATQKARTAVALEQVAAVREIVAKGFFSVVEFKRRQDNHLSQEQNESSLVRQLASKDGELVQTRHARQQLPLVAAERIAAFRASIAEIEAKLTEADGRRAYRLSAPIAGRVSSLQAVVGKLAEPSIPQLAIVPAGDFLAAELLVPARAIGFVAPGQTVRIGYDAFPFQRFGLHEGIVETVSHTLLKPDEVVGPVTLKEPSYRVTVRPRDQAITAYGQEIALQADMQLRADILFDRRSFAEWLFDPILSSRTRM